ncbi:CD226 antigen isoform X2 [Alosa sapidissima]|uniref:CD226 antigen isoform X2 n=1 Tax=Alosa sapidissima TaxID=34773 RepID=UPI001C08336D|nr:CD226 antigen isoform X2 [Alosa sapidissima]
MEAVQRDYWYSLALLTFLIILKASLQKSGDETVRLEDGMILECLCPWDGNLSMVSWTKVPGKNPIAVYHPRFGPNLAVGYNDRLAFLNRTSMDGSISIANVTEEDAGLYQCSMQTFPLGTWTRDVQVIKENFLPHSEVTMMVGGNLTVVCPIYNYTVSEDFVSEILIRKDDQEHIIGRCILQDGTYVLKDQHETIPVNCADPHLGVTFELNNLIIADEGRYRCLMSTEHGVEIFTYQLTVHSQDELHTPTIGPEEAGSSSTLHQVQVLEDVNPSEGIPVTELPPSDTAHDVTDPSAPAERMFTTDSASSATTNSVRHPSGPVEGMSTTALASVIAITVPHTLASTKGMSTTEMAPSVGNTIVALPQAPSEGMLSTESVIATTVPHPTDPPLTEAMSTTKLAPAVITTAGFHLPEGCRSPPQFGPCRGSFPRFYYDVTTQSCESFIYGGCRGNSNSFLTQEECESTCKSITAPSEGKSTTDLAPSVVAITVPPPAPSEEASSTESAPDVATTVPLPPEPSEGISATEPAPSAKATTVPHSTDNGYSWMDFLDIPEEYRIYVYAGSGAAGLLLLLLIIILVCLYRRKKRREAYRVKLHPGRRWRDSEQGGFYDRMRKGTRWGRQEPIYANVRTGHKHKYKPKQKRKR